MVAPLDHLVQKFGGFLTERRVGPETLDAADGVELAGGHFAAGERHVEGEAGTDFPLLDEVRGVTSEAGEKN